MDEKRPEVTPVLSRILPRLVAVDAAILSTLPLLALFVRFLGAIPEPHLRPYVVFLPALALWRLAALHLAGAYDFRSRLTSVDHLFGAVRASLLGVLVGYLLLMFIQSYYWPEMRLSRLVATLDFLFVILWTWSSRSVVLALLARGGYRIRVLVAVTSSQDGKMLADEFSDHSASLLELIRIEGEEAHDSGKRDWAAVLTARVDEGDVDRVVVAEMDLSPEGLRRLLESCDLHKTELLLYPNIGSTLLAGTRVTSLAGMPLLSLRPPFLTSPYLYGKRLIDVVASVALLLLTTPVIMIAAVAIYVETPGHVYLRQRRVGRGGRPFNLYKLRTMVPDAEADSGPVLTTPDDPRVTRVGRFLRQARIDELPQLWNVLRGDMSLVGPRPERPEFVEVFLAENPLYGRRMLVHPGLSGLAQVHGRYDSDYVNKLRYDLIYLNSISLVTDLRIIISTVRTVLTGRGAM